MAVVTMSAVVTMLAVVAMLAVVMMAVVVMMMRTFFMLHSTPHEISCIASNALLHAYAPHDAHLVMSSSLFMARASYLQMESALIFAAMVPMCS
eukprot:10961754-Lingulodinium_polyedra.AAC.1